jgi:hypothetical protein
MQGSTQVKVVFQNHLLKNMTIFNALRSKIVFELMTMKAIAIFVGQF